MEQIRHGVRRVTGGFVFRSRLRHLLRGMRPASATSGFFLRSHRTFSPSFRLRSSSSTTKSSRRRLPSNWGLREVSLVVGLLTSSGECLLPGNELRPSTFDRGANSNSRPPTDPNSPRGKFHQNPVSELCYLLSAAINSTTMTGRISRRRAPSDRHRGGRRSGSLRLVGRGETTT